MLIDFSVGNFRSIKGICHFSMEPYFREKADKQPTLNSIFSVDKHLKLLKTVVFYGPTASGKTNITLALSLLRKLLLTDPHSIRPADKLPLNRFRLRVDLQDEPAYFRIALVIDGVKYGYGFFAKPDCVVSEWLECAATSDTSDVTLFRREDKQITIFDRYPEGIGIGDSIPDNTLLLPLIAQSGGAISTKLLDWLTRLQVISRVNHPDDLQAAQTLLQEKKHREAVLRFLQKLNVGIADIQSHPTPHAAGAPPIQTIHEVYDAERNVVGTETFAFEDESAGTQRLFTLAIPIITALEQGSPIFIDDLSAHLHPHTLRAIVRLFTEKQQNPNNAQLMFTTHDASLLTSLRWRREQVHVVEKDDEGDTIFFTMAQFGATKLEYMERDYLAGRYRGTPSPTSDLLPLSTDDQ